MVGFGSASRLRPDAVAMTRFSLSLLTWLVFSLGLSHAAVVPFVLPWNDATPSLTDLSAMNPPIGPGSRVTTNRLGQFTVGGERIRFLGMNFAGDSPFMATNQAEAVAARLSKFGINNVRFHHMDAPWATGGGLIRYSAGNTRSLQPSQLQRLHFLVSRLKAHGVYANINLLVGREFKAADGLPAEVEGMDWKDQHVLGFFNDTALALHQEYATQLLTPVNPFTGQSLALDPAVAFVELQNENGIIQKWLDGGIDRFPAVFSQQLQTKWNAWLAARYPNTAALTAAWKIVDQPLGASMLLNGNFAQGTRSWILEQNGGAQATMSVASDFNGQPALKVQTSKQGTASWHVQWNQVGLKVSQSAPYTVSFWAKAVAPVNLETSVMQAHADWQPVGFSQTFRVTNGWQRFTASFQATSTDAAVRLNFGGLGLTTNTVWLADVQLQPGGQIGVFPGSNPSMALENRAVPLLRRGSGGFPGTLEARRDWMRFLVSLESAYWTAMRDHVRSACGYPGLIFGTILGNSPANVQNQLDVIDAHGYWQHPEFPGAAWDPVNWRIKNISMLNTFDNTFTGLARQRVRGRPFTVTEYQHPSPNSYSGEGPLLVAAYGALQDWDGIWFFDYGPGESSVPMGMQRGFFDTAQHPSKMANLVLAAQIFRRGDVKPAEGEVALSLPLDREINVLADKSTAWNIANAGLLGLSPEWALVKRISLNLDPAGNGATNAPAKPSGSSLVSDTGELQWGRSNPSKGWVSVQSPRTRALIGFADGQMHDLGGIQVRPGTTSLGWCTLGLSLMRGDSITNGTSLLVVSGEVTNTGMAWTDATHVSVGNHWGKSPTLAEVVPFTMLVPVAPNRVKVWSLDPKGQRLKSISVGNQGGQALLSVDASAATLWYEVEIAPPLAGFQLWRSTMFDTAELADPATSGETATPARDGVPNLLKYALNLPAKQPATQGLPVAGWWQQGTESYLALTYSRLKSALDLEYAPEVSSDLTRWDHGPGVIGWVSAVDHGDTETVTERDLRSVQESDHRYIRLRVSLK